MTTSTVTVKAKSFYEGMKISDKCTFSEGCKKITWEKSDQYM